MILVLVLGLSSFGLLMNKAAVDYRQFERSVAVKGLLERVRRVSRQLSALGRQGIAFIGNHYQAQTEYLYTRLNEIKSAMIEEATRETRVVAGKFAADSDSVLGRVKPAPQGPFTIEGRDENNSHVKKCG
ncbi:hypothetical protein [Zhongshania sp.]|uniref:hypothetical protein n=1 Tax=Zhongshania sp. TaxID=1971902 RepID=UPI0035643182